MSTAPAITTSTAIISAPAAAMLLACDRRSRARAGRRDEAVKILNEVLNYPPAERDQACHSFAGTYIALGDHARAIEWLDRGVQVGTVDWFALTMSPWFDALRSDPRFAALIQKAAAKENRGV